jgi:ribosome-associated translation inhibitor RaiA
MDIPTEITFHELPPSDAVELSIQRWVARIEPLHPRIRSCHVFVERAHRRHRNGDDYQVHVHLDIPGAGIAATRIHHQDIYVAVADAFRSVRRQLLEQNQQRSGHGRQQLSA